MLGVQDAIGESELKNHLPVFEDTADHIMLNMADKSPSDLASILGISNQLAIKAISLAYDFPHKLTGYSALKAFIGDAYRALDISSISSEKLMRSKDNLRIISSVYGILKPDDIIKPYRSEFNKNVAAGDLTPIKAFKQKNTIEFVKFIKENKIKDVIDLLPADADKCLDWKIIRAFTSVRKICFQTLSSQGKLKTPIAKRLKELRGTIYRFILEKDIQSFRQLISTDSSDFIYSPEHSRSGLPVFLVD